MNCPRCQTSNPHHAAFCLNCAFKLELLRETSAPPSPNLRKGLAIASLVLGALSCFTLSLLFVGAITGMIIGITSVVRINSNPEEYGGKGMAMSGIALSAVSLAVGCLVAFTYIPRYYQARIASNEWAAYGAVKHIGWCQARFFEKHSRFADLDELEAAGIIDKSVIARKGADSGYSIEVRVNENTFEISAIPVEYGTTGRKSFYLTGDFLIHAADKQGREADSDDPAYY